MGTERDGYEDGALEAPPVLREPEGPPEAERANAVRVEDGKPPLIDRLNCPADTRSIAEEILVPVLETIEDEDRRCEAFLFLGYLLGEHFKLEERMRRFERLILADDGRVI